MLSVYTSSCIKFVLFKDNFHNFGCVNLAIHILLLCPLIQTWPRSPVASAAAPAGGDAPCAALEAAVAWLWCASSSALQSALLALWGISGAVSKAEKLQKMQAPGVICVSLGCGAAGRKSWQHAGCCVWVHSQAAQASPVLQHQPADSFPWKSCSGQHWAEQGSPCCIPDSPGADTLQVPNFSSHSEILNRIMSSSLKDIFLDIFLLLDIFP